MKEEILMVFIVLCFGLLVIWASLWKESKLCSMLGMAGTASMIGFLFVGLRVLSQPPIY